MDYSLLLAVGFEVTPDGVVPAPAPTPAPADGAAPSPASSAQGKNQKRTRRRRLHSTKTPDDPHQSNPIQPALPPHSSSSRRRRHRRDRRHPPRGSGRRGRRRGRGRGGGEQVAVGVEHGPGRGAGHERGLHGARRDLLHGRYRHPAGVLGLGVVMGVYGWLGGCGRSVCGDGLTWGLGAVLGISLTLTAHEPI